MTIWPASVPVRVEFWPDRTQHRSQELIGLADVSHGRHAALMKRRRAQDEDGCVDEKRKTKGQRGIECGEADGLALPLRVLLERAGLHQAGMKIQIVRHHRGSKDADGEIEHLAVPQDFRDREKPARGFDPQRARKKDFVGEAPGDGHDQRNHQRLKHAESAALQPQHQQHVQTRQQHAGKERQSEKQFQRDGGAENFREVASGDGDFA